MASDDILDILFHFIHESRAQSYIAGNSEYKQTLAYCSQQRRWLEEHLSPEALEVLELLRDNESDVTYWESLALFRASLALGLELGRL